MKPITTSSDTSESNNINKLKTQIQALHKENQMLSNQLNELQKKQGKYESQAKTWRERLDALLTISEETGDTLFTNQVFQTIAATVLEITVFDGMGLGIFDKEAQCFRLAAHQGLFDLFEIGKITPEREGDFHHIVMHTLQPVYTSNFASDSRVSKEEDLLAKAGLQSLAFIPILANGELMGIFGLHAKEKITWDPDTLRWLSFVGRQIGVLMHQAQMADQLQVSATLDERVRLGRELHDHLGQILGYLNFKTQVTQQHLSEKKIDKVSAELAEMEEVSGQAYDEIRDSIMALRMMPVLDTDLISALQKYAQEFSKRNQIAVHLDTQNWNQPPISPKIAIQILRVIQEALTNVRRHAQAQQVVILCQTNEDTAVFQVIDDGQGFNPDKVDGREHLGLQTMRERVEGIGARFNIHSQLGQGTKIRIELPIQKPNLR